MKSDLSRSFVKPALLGMAALGGAGAAQAQGVAAPVAQAPADDSRGSAAQDVDIIVTAQKREQRLQDVPVAVQVLTGEALTAQGVRQFSDLTRATPSLVIKTSENPVNASVSIRGIGTFAFSPGIEPSVAVQVDDVPVAFLARAFADLSDIERLEVLRGPQSTLYGRSASAGLINIVTQAPTGALTGRIGGLITADAEYAVTGALSGPLTDTIGFRVSGNVNTWKGNVYNRALDRDVNGRKTYSVRGKLSWSPSAAVTVDGQISYVDGSTTIGRPFIAIANGASFTPGNGVAPAPFAAYAPGITVGRDNRTVSNNVTSGTSYSDFAPSLRVSVDLGGPTLMSITAFDHYKEFDILDQDESALTDAQRANNVQSGNFNSHQFSQEVRLVSPGGDSLRYTLGLFYSNFRYTRDFQRGPYFAIAGWNAWNGIKNYAAFGQLEYDILDGTTLIGGLRYGNDKIAVTFNNVAGSAATFNGDSAKDYVTYRAGLQHKFTPDVMAFLTYATGHKGQAYDISTGFNAIRLNPIQPETSRDWQLGLKSQFADRRLTLNVTLFNTSFENFQAQGIDINVNPPQFRVSNVGALRTRGVELEASLRATPVLTLSSGVTYNDAKITSFPLAGCYGGQTAAQGCIPAAGAIAAHQDLAGFRPAQAPEWKLTAGLDFNPHLTDRLDGVAQVNYAYQSRINYSLNQDPVTIQPGYGILNLNLGVRDADRGWEIVGFVNNLFDKQYFANLTNSRGSFTPSLAIQSYLPRDFRRFAGIRGSFNF